MIEIIATYFLSVLSLILSYSLYFKGKTKKIIAFVYIKSTLQSKNHPSIKIYFDEKEVDNLNSLVIAFYNNGNHEVRKSDVPEDRFPLIILDPKLNILSYKILVSTDCSNKITIDKVSNNILKVAFDYLNSFDGCLIEVIYNGETENKRLLNIDTKLIGVHKIQLSQYERPLKKNEINEAMVLFSSMFIFSIYLVSIFIADLQYYKLIPILIIYIFSYLLFKRKFKNRTFISKNIPKQLREYKYT